MELSDLIIIAFMGPGLVILSLILVLGAGDDFQGYIFDEVIQDEPIYY